MRRNTTRTRGRPPRSINVSGDIKLSSVILPWERDLILGPILEMVERKDDGGEGQ